MSRQYFADLAAEPKIDSLTAITATTETALWDVATRTPIPANFAVPGRAWHLMAGGIYSTAAGAATLTITPRVGLVIGGITLGISIAQNTVVSLTNEAWWLEGILTCRSVGLAGATSTFMFSGHFSGGGAAATASSGMQIAFGGTLATADSSIATGLWLGWTLSVAGSCQPLSCVWRSLN